VEESEGDKDLKLIESLRKKIKRIRLYKKKEIEIIRIINLRRKSVFEELKLNEQSSILTSLKVSMKLSV
jgi:hypothetical protein